MRFRISAIKLPVQKFKMAVTSFINDKIEHPRMLLNAELTEHFKTGSWVLDLDKYK